MKKSQYATAKVMLNGGIAAEGSERRWMRASWSQITTYSHFTTFMKSVHGHITMRRENKTSPSSDLRLSRNGGSGSSKLFGDINLTRRVDIVLLFDKGLNDESSRLGQPS